MEIIIAVAILGLIGYWAYSALNKEKSDGSHPLDSVAKPAEEKSPEPVVAKVEEVVAEVKEVAKKTTTRAKKALDVNNDGKVNAKDAVAAVKKVATKAKAPAKAKKPQ